MTHATCKVQLIKTYDGGPGVGIDTRKSSTGIVLVFPTVTRYLRVTWLAAKMYDGNLDVILPNVPVCLDIISPGAESSRRSALTN